MFVYFTFETYFFDKKKSFGSFIPWKPLHYASAMGSQKFVDCLIKNGADPSATDSTGRTAQQISDLLNTGCKVKTKFELALPTETDYSNFVHHRWNISSNQKNTWLI
jgi:ankyrin repeat protein